MGTATVELYPDRVDEMRQIAGVRIIRETDMGDGIVLLLVETDLLPAGYHGQMDAILEDDTVRFRRSCDT
jgi:hypothetical protein